jgi:hypothetical protein
MVFRMIADGAFPQLLLDSRWRPRMGLAVPVILRGDPPHGIVPVPVPGAPCPALRLGPQTAMSSLRQRKTQ